MRSLESLSSSVAGPLALSLLAGCAGPVPEARADTSKSAQPQRIETAEVVVRQVPVTIPLTGTLLARRESRLAADTGGKVVAIGVERGQRVERGTVIARLDGRSAALAAGEAAATAKAARAQSELAKADCERADRLFAGGAIAKAELDRTKAQCSASTSQATAADARAALAGKSAADAILRAPFSGIVVERHVEVGEYVRADAPVVTIVDVDSLRIEMTVPEIWIGRVATGQALEFSVQAFEGESFSAHVERVAPAMRRASRDLVIEAVVDDPDARLRPGMFATARVPTGDRPLPLVPATALRKTGSAHRVFAVRDGRLQERVVEIRGEHDGLVALAGGLSEGDRVAVQLGPEIKDGLAVQ